MAAYSRLGRAQFVTLGGNGQPGGSVLGLPEQWLMHDGSGQAFADATPNDNTITTTDITWGTGTGVTSPSFNGSTSTGVAAQTAITNFDGTQPFWISIWVNTASSGTQILAGTINSANSLGWAAFTSGFNVGLEIVNTAGGTSLNAVSTTPISSGTTTNIIIAYDGSESSSGISAWINGTSVSMPPGGTFSSSAASGLPLTVGSLGSAGGDFYSGSMSNLQIFSGTPGTGGNPTIAAIQTAGP
jgi:Concanavalin A-like lectin/glucanases superfamily